MRRWFSHVGLLLAATTLLVACSGDDESEETTTTTAAPITTIGTTQAPVTTTTLVTTVAPEDTTTTSTSVVTLGGVEFPEYAIVERIEGPTGDTLVILFDPLFEGALTDIDLQNLLAEVVEDFPPVDSAYLVSSQEAADIVLLETVTAAQQEVLDNHLWAQLEEGFRIIFKGPFEGVTPLLISS